MDEALLRRRLLVEALHELGHVGGLDHCGEPSCAMAEAATVEDVDRKEPAFCGSCADAFGGLAPPRPRT
jgi:archaemetzincin